MPLRFHAPDATLESRVAPATSSTPTVFSPAPVEVTSSPEVESYLLRVESHLKRVPEAVRADARHELRTHLESLIAANIEMGDEPHIALVNALRQIGKPETIAIHYRRAWVAPALYRRREALRETGRFATLAVVLAIFAFYALSVLIDQIFHFNRTGNSSLSLFFSAIGLPLVSQITFVVPLLIGRQYGKRWAEARKANTRFWLLLATQAAAWSVAEQFLLSLLVVRGHFKLFPRWEQIEILETQCCHAIPLAILAALCAYQRRTAPSRNTSLGAYAAFAGWLSLAFLNHLNLYAYSADSLKSIPLHAAEHYYFLALLIIAVIGEYQRRIHQKRNSEPTSIPA